MLLVIKLISFLLVPVVIFAVSFKQDSVSKSSKSRKDIKNTNTNVAKSQELPGDFTIADLISKETGGTSND